MVATLSPKYPVTDPDPGLSTTLRNFNLADLAFVAAGTIGSGTFGYLQGLPRRNAGAVVGSIVGAMGSLMFSYQSSHMRLTGYRKA
mmetsp:Transcript_17425/g.25835  ORF Transcript_17425/g.25835 Transcript_17425/m.25835 type:complete len:86 (+) Transcript_17425:113-370(+)